MKGPRIEQDPERPDSFVQWIELNKGDTHTYQNLNEIFRKMRQTDNYLSLRMNMKLQYEILRIGLKQSMMDLVNDRPPQQATHQPMYYYFSTFFVDDKENLKDITTKLGDLPDDEDKVKEECYLLLSFFILTFENR